MFFRDIIGQEEIKKHLIQSVKSGQIPHARLFYGPDGIGKLAMAVAYARYLNCTNRGEEESCGTCPSCKHITSLMHPDLNFVFPIYKSAKLKKRISDDYITEWRKALSETHYLSLEHWLSIIGAENAQPKIYTDESSEVIRKLSFKSFESEYKVMIIWHPELMVDECANKLLKIIEEPYNKTIFLLVSNRPDIILPTILSRTQRLNFRKIPNEEIATELVRHFSVEPSDAANVARISNGSYRKAMEIMQQTGENELFFELFTKMMRNSYARRIKEMKQWSDEVSKLGRETEKRFLQYTQRMLRENYIFNTRVASLTYMNEEERGFSSRFAPFINEKNIIGIMESLGKAERDIIQNANAKIVFFDLSIKLILMLKNS